MQKTFSYDIIYIIESLSLDERKTGTLLYDDIVKRRCEQFGHTKSRLISVDNKFEFNSALDDIRESIFDEQLYPYIHFEIHGGTSNQGLVLNSDDIIKWTNLISQLREINVSCRNNLFVSFATCYSAYFIKVIANELNKPTPVLGLVAATENIGEKDLEFSFLDYFDVLLTTNDVTKAIKALNTSIPGKQLFSYMTSDALFDRLYQKHVNPRIQNTMIRDIQKTVKTRDPSLSNKQIRDKVNRWKQLEQSEQIKKLRQVFLMLNH